MIRFQNNLVRIVSFSVLATACGCDVEIPSVGAAAVHMEQGWRRDVANPVVTGNGTTILQMSDPVVVHDNGQYRMWFSSVGADATYASIGYAESGDGQSWSVPVVVLSPGARGSWDDQTTEIPSVLRDDDDPDPAKRYKMWYGGSDSTQPTHTKVGYAYSPDGKVWTRLPASQSPYGKEGLVMVAQNSGPGDYAVVAEPSVVQRRQMFHMWYSSWDGNALVISYAVSRDGVDWRKSQDNPVLRHTPRSWESGGLGLDGTVAQPTVLWDGERAEYKMWYGSFDGSQLETYAGIGFVSSADGVKWNKYDSPVFVHKAGSPGEEQGVSTGPCVLLHDGTLHLWYSGVDSMYRRVLNHAVSSGSQLEIAPVLLK